VQSGTGPPPDGIRCPLPRWNFPRDPSSPHPSHPPLRRQSSSLDISSSVLGEPPTLGDFLFSDSKPPPLSGPGLSPPDNQVIPSDRSHPLPPPTPLLLGVCC